MAGAADHARPPPSLPSSSPWLRPTVRAALHAEVQARLGAAVAAPSILKSKAAQKALLPHDEHGELLPLDTPIESFKVFGSGVYAYMRWFHFMGRVFVAAFAFSLPNLIHNLTVRAPAHLLTGASQLPADWRADCCRATCCPARRRAG